MGPIHPVWALAAIQPRWGNTIIGISLRGSACCTGCLLSVGYLVVLLWVCMLPATTGGNRNIVTNSSKPVEEQPLDHQGK